MPVRFKHKPISPPICVRCSRQLIRVSRYNKGYLWALGLAGTGMALITLPDLLEHWASGSTNPGFLGQLQWSLGPEDARMRQVRSVDANDLLVQLEEADQQWHPQEEILPDGSTRYIYKRRTDEPDLSIAELKKLVQAPATFLEERRAILTLLGNLRRAGVKVVLAQPLKTGAAAEWDHAMGALRIDPKMPQKGSVDFLRVLSHEAVHVAQSCKAGTLRSKPKTLGLVIVPTETLSKKISDPVYANTSRWEKSLEMEAYSIQDDASRVNRIVKRECKLLAA